MIDFALRASKCPLGLLLSLHTGWKQEKPGRHEMWAQHKHRSCLLIRKNDVLAILLQGNKRLSCGDRKINLHQHQARSSRKPKTTTGLPWVNSTSKLKWVQGITGKKMLSLLGFIFRGWTSLSFHVFIAHSFTHLFIQCMLECLFQGKYVLGLGNLPVNGANEEGKTDNEKVNQL